MKIKANICTGGGGQPLENKAFTLIELLAVIVILAIIALIATPIVLNIINESKIAARKSSFDNIERATKIYLMNEDIEGNTEVPKSIKLKELVEKGYVETNEDLNNNIFIKRNNDEDYDIYYEGRDKLEGYKSLKSLIESDTNHIKKNVVVNGNTVNKVYGKKADQTKMKNYVVYSGQLWEVVETNESNNTIKLVSAASLTSIAYGNTNDWNTSWVRKWLNEYFYDKLERTDLIRDTEFCIDNIDVEPNSYTKMSTCTNKVTEKVGLLTYEDYIYALDGETIQNGNSYLDEDELSWLITPTTINSTYIWHTNHNNPSTLTINDNTFKVNTYGQGVRPVISISDSVLVKQGSGTRKDPYILSSERSLNKNKKLNLARVGDYVYIDESKNPYVSEIVETRINKVSEKTSTSKVRYRIVNINEDGTIKLERADVLRNLPNTIATDGMYIPFYSIDGGSGSTSCLYDPTHKYGTETLNGNTYTGGCNNHNIFNPNDGSGNFEKNTGDSLAYYLNNANNSFYNWYSEKAKSMIVKTSFNLDTSGHGKDYSNLNNNPNGTYPYKTNDGIVNAYVGLPSWGEMYTGNGLNLNYWYINRFISLSNYYVSNVAETGYGSSSTIDVPWVSVRPVITLNSNTYITSGEGTPTNPYSLDV